MPNMVDPSGNAGHLSGMPGMSSDRGTAAFFNSGSCFQRASSELNAYCEIVTGPGLEAIGAGFASFDQYHGGAWREATFTFTTLKQEFGPLGAAGLVGDTVGLFCNSVNGNWREATFDGIMLLLNFVPGGAAIGVGATLIKIVSQLTYDAITKNSEWNNPIRTSYTKDLGDLYWTRGDAIAYSMQDIVGGQLYTDDTNPLDQIRGEPSFWRGRSAILATPQLEIIVGWESAAVADSNERIFSYRPELISLVWLYDIVREYSGGIAGLPENRRLAASNLLSRLANAGHQTGGIVETFQSEASHSIPNCNPVR